MGRSPYDDVDLSQLILRDWLAIDRTVLANERTLLAYVRTSLAMAVVGGSLLKFFDSAVAEWVGILFLIIGALTMTIGLVRYARLRRRLGITGRHLSGALQARTASGLNESDPS